MAPSGSEMKDTNACGKGCIVVAKGLNGTNA